MISYQPIIQNLKNDPACLVDVLRLDLIDAEISGNKWFKLKQNLELALAGGATTVITFGGAFSNHIAATAAACKKLQLKSIGIIRGEAPPDLNPTLKQAQENGMVLHFVSRDAYSSKKEGEFKNYLEDKYGPHYLIPEGGNNHPGVWGCKEIIDPGWNYDYIFCACGTGTTYAGIIADRKENQRTIGISVLKGENTLPREVEKLLFSCYGRKIKLSGNEALDKESLDDNCIINAYAFNGYAGFNKDLLVFKNRFEEAYAVPLDHIYTAKLMYAVFDLMQKNKLRQSARILVIHSGGLQGNVGFEERYHLIPSL